MQIIIEIQIIVEHGSGERIEPANAELAKHKFKTLKVSSLTKSASIFFLFQIFDACLIIIDALYLYEEHDQSENGKQQRFEQQSNDQDNSPRRYLMSTR